MDVEKLCLSLLRQQGVARQTVLVLAEDGILFVPEESVTVLGEPLSNVEENILRSAKVAFRKNTTVTPIRWQITCHGQSWVCAVNDKRLDCGDFLFVQPGDRVDVGLLRFMVVAASDTVSLRQTEERSDETEVAADFFELSSLAEKQEWDMTDAEDSPFAIVDVRASFPEEAASAKTPESEKDVFVRLADEYARVIMNPDCLYQQHWGVTSSNLMAQNVFLKEPSDEQDIQNTQELDTEQSLEDFVMGKLTIHDVFNHFGINDLQTLGVTEVYEDVLSLFAQDLKQKRIERIPARTRDEHHHISLDSHYQPEETSASFIKSKSED